MKLNYDRKSKDPTYFIQMGIRNGKKTTTKNVARIGKHSELLKITDDPLAYAKEQVRKYNEEYKKENKVSKLSTIPASRRDAKKKQQLIRNIQEYWAKQKKPRLKGAADAFGISSVTAKRYLSMTQEDISRLDHPNHYKKRESPMNAWLNVIYKMMTDGCSNELIYFYIKRQKAFHESERNLADYIYLIRKNNFPDRTPFNAKTVMEWVLPPEVIIITRTDLLKYILTCNPKTKRDPNIEKYIDQIKSQYPVVEKVETMFKEFHALLMGKDETKLDEYLGKYGASEIESFCNGIKRDITPVKNAISLSVNSGFVEGNNNKFKVLKRIVYGRSGLVNLEKKCKLAFLPKNQDFSLSALL